MDAYHRMCVLVDKSRTWKIRSSLLGYSEMYKFTLAKIVDNLNP